MKQLRVPGQSQRVTATPRPVSPSDGILDAALGEVLKEEGIARAEAGAPPEWKALALIAVERVARQHSRFTSDMVWVELGPENRPRDGRALGHVMRVAAAMELIEGTSEYEATAQPSRHRAPVRFWVSRVYRP